MALTALKYKHDGEKGVMHYVIYNNQKVGLSLYDSKKVEYINKHGHLDVSFDLKSKDFSTVNVQVSKDKAYIQSVYDYMLEVNNTYYKDGFEGLCVLIFN